LARRAATRRARQRARNGVVAGAEGDAKARALTFDTVDFDGPSDGVNDAVTDRQSESGSLADGFGREKRGKNLLATIFWDPGPIVRNGHNCHRAGLFGADRDAIALGIILLEGLSGVDDQVQENLNEPCVVAIDESDLAELADDLGAEAV